MTLQEIIKSEERQNSEDLGKIHLYLENDWWRAYEWSAYLCHHFPNTLKENEKLKVTHKDVNYIENGLVLVGLKLEHFNKYLPQTKIEQVEDKHIVVEVSKVFPLDNITDYRKSLDEWKKTIPVKHEENKTKKDIKPSPLINNPHVSFMTIMQDILAYPIESKTPIDNVLFIREIKDKILKLIY